MKYFEKYDNFNSFILNYYKVTINDENSTNILYEGIDKEKAEEIYNNISHLDVDDMYKPNSSFELIQYQYKWVNEDPDDEIEDYPLEDYYDDSEYYEEQGIINEEIIDSKDIKTLEEIKKEDIEKQYDYLKEEIISYIKSLSEDYKNAAFLGSTFYSLIPYLDGYIQIRIADHFFNLSNINLGYNVPWDVFKDIERIDDKHENIYGFLSIHILDPNDSDDYKKDKRNFIKNYIIRNSNSKYPDLINYITYDNNIDEFYSIDYKTDIDDGLKKIKNEINNAKDDGIYENDDMEEIF